MTLKVMNHVWEHFPEGGSKFLIMLALADYAGRDDGSYIFPSMASLAAKCRMSERQVQRIVKELHGTPDKPGEFLELLTVGNKGGRRRPNHYRIRMETLSKCQGIEQKNPDISGETLTPRVKNPDIAMSDEPNNPNYNPNRKNGAAADWAPVAETRQLALEAYIRQLEKLPENMRPPDELNRAKSELNELVRIGQ